MVPLFKCLDSPWNAGDTILEASSFQIQRDAGNHNRRNSKKPKDLDQIAKPLSMNLNDLQYCWP